MADVEVDAVDLEPEEDNLMEEEEGALEEPPKLKSTITMTGAVAKRTKGRGFQDSGEADRNHRLAFRDFDSLQSDGGPGPQRSIEGRIILVTGVHEEAQEDHLHEIFGEYGEVKNLHLNLDRRTGYVKGYALIEYEKKQEVQAAISQLDKSALLGHTIVVDWGFSNGPLHQRNVRRRSPHGGHRSRSPTRRRY